MDKKFKATIESTNKEIENLSNIEILNKLIILNSILDKHKSNDDFYSFLSLSTLLISELFNRETNIIKSKIVSKKLNLKDKKNNE